MVMITIGGRNVIHVHLSLTPFRLFFILGRLSLTEHMRAMRNIPRCEYQGKYAKCISITTKSLSLLRNDTVTLVVINSTISQFATDSVPARNLVHLQFINSSIGTITLSKDGPGIQILTIKDCPTLNMNRVHIHTSKLITVTLRNVGMTETSAIPINLGNTKQLTLSRISIKSFYSSMFKMQSVRSITINDSNLKRVEIGYLPSLRYLSIVRCNISSFENILIYTPEVWMLNIMENKFVSPKTMVAFPRSIKILNLSKNRIVNFSSRYFMLTSLQKLYLDENNIHHIDLSTNFEQLEILSMKNLKVKTLNTSEFNLPKLKTLNIFHSATSHIEIKRGFEKLQYLSLGNTNVELFGSSNDIINLPDLIYLILDGSKLNKLDLRHNFKSLRVLSCSNTSLEYFDALNWNIPKIERITLDLSPIKGITLPITASNLKSVSAANTQIQIFDTRFQNFPNLKKLDLSNTLLEHFRLGNSMPRLEILSLRRFNSAAFETEWGNLSSLKNLDLAQSSLKTLDLGDNLQNLRLLDLQHTSLTHFSIPSTLKTNINELKISGSLIKSLDFKSGMKNLKILAADSTQIKQFDASKCSLPNLTYLSFDGSPLTMINLDGLVLLQHLRLSKSNLTKLNLSAAYLPKLKSLVLDGNPTMELILGTELKKLETLYLRANNLTSFNFSHSNMDSVKGLRLTENNLTSIDISNFPKLELLDLTRNGNVQEIKFNPKLLSLKTLGMDDHSFSCNCQWLNLSKERKFKYNPKMCKPFQNYTTVESLFDLMCSNKSDMKQLKILKDNLIDGKVTNNSAYPIQTTAFPWGIGKWIFISLNFYALERCLQLFFKTKPGLCLIISYFGQLFQWKESY